MVTHIRHWMAYRELHALARRESLAGVEPEAVIRLLHVFARSAAYRSNSPLGFCKFLNSGSALNGRAVVLRLWELARACYLSDQFKRAKWHLVMASCTSLYEKLGNIANNDKPEVVRYRRAA